MAKKKNRKKELKLELKRKGVIQTAGRVVEEVKEVASKAKDAVVETTKTAVKKGAASFEDFAAELDGIASARLETFFEAGIRSAKDFANFTEKELLALKGIGPATIKQLKEKGINLKD